jgi:hypothetical protein
MSSIEIIAGFCALFILLFCVKIFIENNIINGLEKGNEWYLLGIICSQNKSILSFGPQTANVRFAIGKHKLSYKDINLILYIQERLKYSDKGCKIQPLFKKKAIEMDGTIPRIGEGMYQSFLGIRHNGHRLFPLSSRRVMKRAETLQSELQLHFLAGIMDACGVLEDGQLLMPEKLEMFSTPFGTEMFQSAMAYSKKLEDADVIERFEFAGKMDETQSLYSLGFNDCKHYIRHLLRLISWIPSNKMPYSEDMLVLAGIGLQGSDWVSRGKWRGHDQLSCRIQTKKKEGPMWHRRRDFTDSLPMIDCSNPNCGGVSAEGKRGEYRYDDSSKTTQLWQRSRLHKTKDGVYARCDGCQEIEIVPWPVSASWGWRGDNLNKAGWVSWVVPPPIPHNCTNCGSTQNFTVEKYGKLHPTRGFTYFLSEPGEGPRYCISEPKCPFCEKANPEHDIGAEAVPIYLEMSSRIQEIFGSNVEFSMISDSKEQQLSWKAKGSFWNLRLRLMLGLTGIEKIPDNPFEKPPRYLAKWDEKKAAWDLDSLAPKELAIEYIRSVVAVSTLAPSPTHRMNAPGQPTVWRVQYEPQLDAWEWLVPTCLLGQERCGLVTHDLNWCVVGKKVPLKKAKDNANKGKTTTFRGHSHQARFIALTYETVVGFLNPFHLVSYEGSCKTHSEWEANSSNGLDEKCGWDKAKKVVDKFDWATQDEWTRAIDSPNMKTKLASTGKEKKFDKLRLRGNVKPESSHGFNFVRMPTRMKNQVFSGQFDACHTMGCPHIGKCTGYPDFEEGV